MMRRQEEKIDPVRSKFGKIEKEEVPLPDKLLYVETYARTHKKFSFRMLLEKQRSKMHIVVTFLAVLELMKTGMIRVYQEEICGEILNRFPDITEHKSMSGRNRKERRKN